MYGYVTFLITTKTEKMKDEIRKLKHGEKFIIPESDYGKGEVWFINDIYVLFEIPMYGGPPMFADTFYWSQIDSLIEMVQTWY